MIDDDATLDIRSSDDTDQITAILSAAGIDHDYGSVTADWLLAQEDVIEALITAGYQWVRLIDTYPVGAETYTWLYDGDEPELEEVA